MRAWAFPVLVVAAIVALLFAWSLRLRGAFDAWGVLLAGLLVALLGVALDRPYAEPPPPGRATGAIWMLLGLALVATAYEVNTLGVDPPNIPAETVPPLLWAAASVAYLVGVFWTMKSQGPGVEPPACARCGRVATTPVCAGCGARLDA